MKAENVPMDPIEKAIAMLRDGANAPGDEEIKRLLEDVLHRAGYCQKQAKLDADHEAAQEMVRKASEAMMKALKAVHALEPWAETEEGPVCLSSNLPIENPERFEQDVQILAAWGGLKRGDTLETHWALRNGPEGNPHAHSNLMLTMHISKCANPRPAKGRESLPTVVKMLHIEAVELLKRVGHKPASGTGANVARLGALLCVAFGMPLKGGESTKAARLACSVRELFRYGGIKFD